MSETPCCINMYLSELCNYSTLANRPEDTIQYILLQYSILPSQRYQLPKDGTRPTGPVGTVVCVNLSDWN